MRLTFILMLLALCSMPVSAKTEISFFYGELIVDKGPVLSNILPPPEDQGLRGAELAVADSNTTGRFLGQEYLLKSVSTEDEAELLAQIQSSYDAGGRLFIIDAPSAPLRRIASTLASDALIFNVSNPDDALRLQQCSANLFHTYPSRAMLSDALVQWLKAKRMDEVLLIRGQRDGDQAYAAAVQRSGQRFGVEIVEELVWDFDTDLRRAAQRELPLFTQTDEYDFVIVADEVGDFGEYVPFNTWYPRPVGGTQGLITTGWHRVVEQWGAAQLQSRFEKLTGRWMNAQDYAAWAAVRSVAEAVTRTQSAEPSVIRNFLLSADFELAAFKGRPLSYRGWNQQLRQPIALIHPRALVSMSPQEGFLHPRNELDTLGYDEPESECRLN